MFTILEFHTNIDLEGFEDKDRTKPNRDKTSIHCNN